MALWFTADLHFNHAKVIGYSNRPFADLADMNQQLIRNWNHTVADTDTIYVLGDFAFSARDGQPIADIFAQLHGHKHLVTGNHDERNPAVLKLTWESMALLRTIRHEGRRFECCHYPLETWRNAQHGNIHLHGHSHGTLRRQIAHRFDVGVDVASYFPIRAEQILAIADAQTFAAQDHHGD
jgi:calcineurin-like phosphoesterase family protein